MASVIPGRLRGKIVLITGAARGQGAAEARLFAAEGAIVVMTDVIDAEGREAADTIDGATYQHLDVTDESAWRALVVDLIDTHGRLDVLVNNAGVYVGGTIVEMPLEVLVLYREVHLTPLREFQFMLLAKLHNGLCVTRINHYRMVIVMKTPDVIIGEGGNGSDVYSVRECRRRPVHGIPACEKGLMRYYKNLIAATQPIGSA